MATCWNHVDVSSKNWCPHPLSLELSSQGDSQMEKHGFAKSNQSKVLAICFRIYPTSNLFLWLTMWSNSFFPSPPFPSLPFPSLPFPSFIHPFVLSFVCSFVCSLLHSFISFHSNFIPMLTLLFEVKIWGKLLPSDSSSARSCLDGILSDFGKGMGQP